MNTRNITSATSFQVGVIYTVNGLCAKCLGRTVCGLDQEFLGCG
eukprot:CAMPEP_0175923536 /NCGR_PEP_ID=MMETSP0108-20121206/14623_1 /TAXON_ID=195067 ORGANISM="Goniomonas pacifica, Strain CCMP1869" /NCGR_SAMPLE_ID=MMETSP0108 /ASSEMBLY_ACC=CAM_ASM_000204 /LENGTH=43 /DNA_ID= /DNA_START= /DNA_END= /DNA_ORIENTATION=